MCPKVILSHLAFLGSYLVLQKVLCSVEIMNDSNEQSRMVFEAVNVPFLCRYRKH